MCCVLSSSSSFSLLNMQITSNSFKFSFFLLFYLHRFFVFAFFSILLGYHHFHSFSSLSFNSQIQLSIFIISFFFLYHRFSFSFFFHYYCHHHFYPLLKLSFNIQIPFPIFFFFFRSSSPSLRYFPSSPPSPSLLAYCLHNHASFKSCYLSLIFLYLILITVFFVCVCVLCHSRFTLIFNVHILLPIFFFSLILYLINHRF